MRTDILESITPIREIKETLTGRWKGILTAVIVNIFISLFISGLGCQYYLYERNKLRHIIVMNSFSYGVKWWGLSIAIFILLCYVCFKFLRSLNLNRKDYKTGVIRSKTGTFGNAHFQSPSELATNFNIYHRIEDTDEEILGKDERDYVYCLRYPPGKPHSRLFVGSPGSGKSSAIIKTDIYQCIRRGDSIVLTDSKGDLYNETVSIAKAHGYVIKVLNLKPEELKNSNGFNVMGGIKGPTDPQLEIKAQVIANIIIRNAVDLSGKLEYWDETELNALMMGIMHKASDKYSIEHNEDNLYGVYQFFSKATLEDLKEAFMRYRPGTPIRNAYDNFAKASAQNQGQTLNGLTNKLWMLNNPMIGNILSNDEIDLVLPMKRPCIYYVVIPDQTTTFNFISSLFFTTMFNEQVYYSDSLTKEDKKKQLTVYYELDEYRNWGGINNLDEKINTVRSRKINITIILQLMAQLEQIHGEEGAKAIRNACPVKGLLSTSDPETAQYFSDQLGTFTVISEGESYHEASEDVLHIHLNKGKKLGEQGRPLRLPESLMNDEMDRNDILYVIDNMAPVMLKKCFAELGGKPLHFMEAQGMELGIKQTKNYRPRWRKIMEEEAAKKDAAEVVITPVVKVPKPVEPSGASPVEVDPELLPGETDMIPVSTEKKNKRPIPSKNMAKGTSADGNIPSSDDPAEGSSEDTTSKPKGPVVVTEVF